MRCRFLFLFAAFFLSGGPEAQADAAGQDPKLDALVTAFHEAGLFQGVVYAEKDGKVIYDRGFGVANARWDVPNRSDTRFYLSSMAKFYTTVLVMKFVENGWLELDQPIGAHISGLVPEIGQAVTVRQLLNHSSGIMREFTEALPDEGDEPYMLQDAVAAVNETGLMFTPGSDQSYSNTGYFLLANMLEAVSGQPYERLLSRYVTEPAGLFDTGYYDPGRVIPRMASGYTSRLVVFPSPGGEPRHGGSDKKGAGMIYATASDVAGFYRALRAGKILEPETYESMTGTDPENVLGWEESMTMDGEQIFLSTGAAREGYFSAGIWIPSRRAYAVIAANNLNLGRNPAFVFQLIRLLLSGDVEIEVPATPLKDFLDRLFAEGPEAAHRYYQSLDIPPALKSRAGPMQATGAPDSRAGESAEAWAPARPDGGDEWLRLDYEPVGRVSGIRLLETQGPGSLVRIGFIGEDGEIVIPAGEPARSLNPHNVIVSDYEASQANVRSIQLYFDTQAVPGWPQVDAVALIEEGGELAWARSATASSSPFDDENPGLEDLPYPELLKKLVRFYAESGLWPESESLKMFIERYGL